MKLFKKLYFLIPLTLILNGCGGGSTDSSLDESKTDTTAPTGITISGTITYDRIPVNSDHIGLDYDNIRQEKVKNILVDLVNETNQTIKSTSTDTSGFYAFNDVPASASVKIRVYAKMLKSGTPGWDVKVVDNQNSDALYVMDGNLSSSGESSSTRDLNAASGWGGSSYTSERTAAPFAMLDDIYYAMQKILNTNSQAVFPKLQVNWSEGNLDGTYYTDGNLFIYGDADFDTDEYDNHVITHEWGHYYEDKFSRSDSLGGDHGGDDILDIRVAFSEGWGNAFSAMALDDPVYYDTLGTKQGSGFNFNVEDEEHTNAGWYSESSIQRILYDLYDDNDDGSDLLSLGFTPIHDVLTNVVKTTPAFTSIFTFIKALKDTNSADASDIDSIVSNEDIATITDIYGTGRVNKVSAYPYHTLSIGSSKNIVLSNTDGEYNKLSNRQYMRFTISTAGTYTIKVQQTNGSNSDPDFDLFRSSPFKFMTSSINEIAGLEENSINLSAGSYLMDISDYNNVRSAQLNVTVTQ